MKEERSRVKRALGVAGDAVFALVLLFCICAAAVLLCLRGEGLAGAKLGIVQSRSMEPGLRVGDVVRVRRESEYARGQIIVFYRATDLYAGAADAADLGSRPVWIHEIIELKILPDGRIGYLTKGSANVSDDGAYVPQDFVLGRALPLSPFWSRAVGFVASVKGIVLLVLLPCAVMLVLLSRELVYSARTARADVLQEILYRPLDSCAVRGQVTLSRGQKRIAVLSGLPCAHELEGGELPSARQTLCKTRYQGQNAQTLPCAPARTGGGTQVRNRGRLRPCRVPRFSEYHADTERPSGQLCETADYPRRPLSWL